MPPEPADGGAPKRVIRAEPTGACLSWACLDCNGVFVAEWILPMGDICGAEPSCDLDCNGVLVEECTRPMGDIAGAVVPACVRLNLSDLALLAKLFSLDLKPRNDRGGVGPTSTGSGMLC